MIGATSDPPSGVGISTQPLFNVPFAYCVSPHHALAELPDPLSDEQLKAHRAIVLGDSARHLPLRTSGLLSDPKNFYAHREYQALGLPLELGVVSPLLGATGMRLGLTGQANLNPQESIYCLLATVWFGKAKTLSQ